MSGSVTLEFLDRFAAAWNRHDGEAIVSMMTPDAVMYVSAGPHAMGGGLRGRKELLSGIADIFRDLPDAQWRDARHFIAGERGVTQWTFTATRPDGSKIVSPGCDVFTFRDGLIAVKDSFRKQAEY